MPEWVEVSLNGIEVAVSGLGVGRHVLELPLPLQQVVFEEGRLAEVLGCRKNAFEKTIAHLGLSLSLSEGSFTIEGAKLLAQ